MSNNLEINLIKNIQKLRHKNHLFSSEESAKDSLNSVSANTEKNFSSSINLSNFSVGFISLIAGLVLVGGGGIAYSLSRPCVLGECDLIVIVEKNVNNSLNNLNVNYTQESLLNLAKIINQNIAQLHSIPAWSKSHQDAQVLISKYQKITTNINQLIEADKIASSALQMASKLPLSVSEWTQVENIWRRALEVQESISNSDFQQISQAKIDNYKEELELVKEEKNQAVIAEKLIKEALEIAQKNEALVDQVKKLEDLEDIANNWDQAMEKVKSIAPETKQAPLKPELMDQYVQELSIIKERIKQEEIANNLYQEAQKKVKLAENAESENQWTNAVNYWQEVAKDLKEFPENSLREDEINTWQKKAQEKLVLAQKELKLAVNRENAKQELTRVCSSTEKICDYVLEGETIKVFLHPQYLINVATIAQSNTNMENDSTRALIDHINQVEKNYRYISSKYDFTLEIYNPQQKLILVYN